MDDMTDLTASLPVETSQSELNDQVPDSDDIQMGEIDTDLIILDDDSEDLVVGTTADVSVHDPYNLKEPEDANLRLELFTNIYRGQRVELKNFVKPPECNTYFDQGDDILRVYLHNTIFTAKVWMNYDAAEERFFRGDRAMACGKLRLPDEKLESLNSIDPSKLNFRHVRFDICTPFRPLAQVTLEVIHQRSGIAQLRCKGDHVGDGTRVLCGFLNTCNRAIRDRGMMDPMMGLTMSDLEWFATFFRRHPSPTDDDECWEKPAYEGGEWAGIEEAQLSFGRTRSRRSWRD